MGGDGAIYGITTFYVFRIDNAGNVTTFDFGADYGGSIAPLVVGSDGAVYGVTATSVFRIDTAGTFTHLHSFLPYSRGNGAFLALGSDGVLYGVASEGVWDCVGTENIYCYSDSILFRIDSAGTF